jgi:predicted nucleic acid-binding protein
LATYLDASALVKLVRKEAETDALRVFLADERHIVSSTLAVVEVSRVAARGGADPTRVLNALARIDVEEEILDAASTLEPLELSTLDAVHLASALAHPGLVETFVCYDGRLAAAARAAGLVVSAPS